MTRVCYESSAHVSESPARGLFPWEDAWFQMALPQPPATILVPGAGGGREVLALRERGYTVFGFDPAIGQSPNAHGIIRESFEALVNRDENRLRFPGAGGVTFDAVLFGWGSLSHVFQAQMRFHIIQAAHAHCLNGPILFSYWRPEDVGITTRGVRLWRAVGEGVGRVRGILNEEAQMCGFSPNAGLATAMTSHEVFEVGARLGRRVIVGTGAYGHATLALNQDACKASVTEL